MSNNFAKALAPVSSNSGEMAFWQEMSNLPREAFAPGTMEALPTANLLNNFERLENIAKNDPVLRENEFVFQCILWGAATAQIVSLISALIQTRIIGVFGKRKLDQMRRSIYEGSKGRNLISKLGGDEQKFLNILKNLDQKALNKLVKEQVDLNERAANAANSVNSRALVPASALRRRQTGEAGLKTLQAQSRARQQNLVELLTTCNKVAINCLLAATVFMLLSAEVVDEMNKYPNLSLNDIVYMRQIVVRFFVIMGKAVPALTDKVAGGIVLGAELLFGKMSVGSRTTVRGITSVLLSSPLYGQQRAGNFISGRILEGLDQFNLEFRSWAQIMTGKVGGRSGQVGVWLSGEDRPGMIGKVLKAARGAIPANTRVVGARNALSRMNQAFDGVRNLITSITFTLALGIVGYEASIIATRAAMDRAIPSSVRERGLVGSAVSVVSPASLPAPPATNNRPMALPAASTRRNGGSIRRRTPALPAPQNYGTNNNQ